MMNRPLLPATSDVVPVNCTSFMPLEDVLLFFSLPLILTVLVLFIIPAALFLVRTPKRQTGRFKIQLEGQQDSKWPSQDKMRAKLVGIRRGDTNECSECQWKEFDNFSNGKMFAVFEDGDGHFKELTAACFVLPRENSDVLEQCEKYIEKCIIKDLCTGVRYTYNTSSRLSSFNPTRPNYIEPENRILFVRLHKVGSSLETTIRGLSYRCTQFLKLFFQSYWSLTSPFLCTNHTKLTYFDQSTVLVSKVLFVVVAVSVLKAFVPHDLLPFRHYFQNFEYPLRHFTLNGDDLYISTIAALLSFVGSMPVELLLRLIRLISDYKRSKTRTVIEESFTDTCSKQKISVDQNLFKKTPDKSPFQLEATFKTVIEELKEKLASIGLKKSYSIRSMGSSAPSRNGQGSSVKLYQMLHGNDTSFIGKETISLVSKDQITAPSRSSPSTGQPMSSKASRVVESKPYKRKDHIYAEISDDIIADIDEQNNSSASENQRERQQNWPDASFDYLTEFQDPSLLMDIDATRVNFKKDCRQSRYKGANQNSSCAANLLSTSSSLESTNDDTRDTKKPLAKDNGDPLQLEHDRNTKATLQASCAPEWNSNVCTENLTWRNTDSELNDSICNQAEDPMNLNNWASASSIRQQVTLVVDGEYRQFARGDCYTTTQGEDVVPTDNSSKMVKYRDVLTRGIKVKKALLIRGKTYIDNFRDMSKAIIRSLSLSSVGDQSLTSFSDTGAPSGDNLVTDENLGRKKSGGIPHLTATNGQTLHASLQRSMNTERPNMMAKIIYHGVTIAKPEENPSLLHRLKSWLSTIFTNTKAQSDQSDETDTDVGCMANMTNKDVKRRQNHIFEKRKQIVSDTFTLVTMNSSLLNESLHPPSYSTSSEKEALPDVLQSSIFKSMAGKLPFKQPPLQSKSNDEVWRTSPEIQGKRKLCQNRNNNMTKTLVSLGESSSSSSFRDDRILETDLIQLLANPFPEIGDDASSVAPNSSSSQTVLEQLDKVAPWHSSSTTSRSPTPEPRPKYLAFEPEKKKIAHKHVMLNKMSCLEKFYILCSLIFSIGFIVCSTFSVSYLCRQPLQHLWILIVLSVVTQLIGLDLLKAFINSFIHLIWLS